MHCSKGTAHTQGCCNKTTAHGDVLAWDLLHCSH